MIGTVTVTTAVLGILSFFGINNIQQLKALLLAAVGKKDQAVEVTVDGNEVELRKDGKLLVRFNIDAVETAFKSKDETT